MREHVAGSSLFGIHLGNTNTRVAVAEPDTEVRLFFPNILGRKESCLCCSYYEINGCLVPCDELRAGCGTSRIRLDLASLHRGGPGESASPSSELLPHILRRLMGQILMEREWIEHVVVSVPDSLGREQRSTLSHTAEQLGFPVKRIIPHSEAILFAYGYPDLPREEVLALVRIGGTSLSIRLCILSEGRILSLANQTVQEMGTERLDDLLCEQVLTLIKNDPHQELNSDPETVDRVRKKLEAARGFLRPGIPFPFHARGMTGPLTVEPDQAWEAVHPLHDQIGRFLKKTLNEAGLKKETISQALIAGGGCRVPYLVHAVEEGLGIKVSFPPTSPEDVIARGAAINGYYYRYGKPPSKQAGTLELPDATVLRTATVPVIEVEKTKITKITKTYVISLRSSEQEDKVKTFENQDEISIGRRAENHLPFETAAVSRTHAKIEFHDGTFFIIDRSANGTFLNGDRLVKWQRRKIKKGDTIQLTSMNGPWIKIESIT